MTTLSPFHLAIPVRDLEEARDFYTRVLGCGTGREDSALDRLRHVRPPGRRPPARGHGEGHRHPQRRRRRGRPRAPLRHRPRHGELGVAERSVEGGETTRWVIEPGIRFVGLPGEQATLFILDPSGNALEFKAFKDIGQLFAK